MAGEFRDGASQIGRAKRGATRPSQERGSGFLIGAAMAAAEIRISAGSKHSAMMNNA